MVQRFFIMAMAVFIVLHLQTGGVSAAGGKGSVEFQIEKSVRAAFVIDEKPAVDIKITIPQGTEDTFAITLITDHSISETIRIDHENPAEQQLHLEFAVEEEGYHHLCAQLLRNGALYYEYEFEQYYVKSVSNEAYQGRGFNVHYQAGADFSKEGRLLKAGGASVIRVGLSWNGVEQEKGIYDFTRGDEMVAAMEEYQLEAICIIDSYHFGHELYPDENGDPMMRTKEQIDAFADFAVAAVKRYPQIKKWEIFNEPNFLMTGEEYFNVVYTVAKRMKAYDPECEIYAGGLAIYDTANFVDGFYIEKLYPYIDGISYHHYNHWRYADGPEFYTTTNELTDKMRAQGGWKNLIMTESGYSTGIYQMEVPEIKQASENVKRAVLCDWYGMDFLAFYNFKNDGYDQEDVENNFGSVTHDYKPKPGYYALKQYFGAANRAVYVGEAYLAEDITAHIYAANDDYFMIAWAKNPNDEADIRNENSGCAQYSFEEEVRIKDMFGEPVGGAVLNVTYQPSYIYGLSKEFCLKAIRENKEHDLFEPVRLLVNQLGFSTEEMEEAYSRMCTAGGTEEGEAFLESCYQLANGIAGGFLSGELDISEPLFSTVLSELYQVCQRGMRVAALFDDVCHVPDGVYEKYETIRAIPQEAADKNLVYLNEPYYKGKSILKKISGYGEKDRISPVKGQKFILASDNTMIFAGTSSAEEVLVKIEGWDGTLVYINLISTDGDGNYYFVLTPDMPYGAYQVTVNDGESLTEPLYYAAAEEYLSVEDKMTAVSLMQADKLFSLYEKILAWEKIKEEYLNPETDAFCWEETNWINITGKIVRLGWTEYSDIILRAYDKTTKELKYIDSTFPDENGAYRFSFPYEGDGQNLEITLNQGGVLVEEPVMSIAEQKLITGEISITEHTDSMHIMLQLQNYFKADRTIQPMIVYYDSGNHMIQCEIMEGEKIAWDESVKDYHMKIPKGAAVVKVFAWNSLTHMTPYMQGAEKGVAVP